ncbi:MAG: T9SS type A sorting domain-containing protein [Ferruginibacter sp.]
MLTSFTQRITLLTSFIAAVCISASAQTSIRPYTQVYSENLKGGSTMFGNTSMHIIDNGAVNSTKMNELGDPNNGQGGLGFSQYGNDNQNMQFTDVDATPANMTVFNMGASGWRYLANGSNQGTAWRTLNNPGAPWVAANASFGYGRTQTTTIPSGNATAYFVKSINIPDPALYSSFTFTYSYDDGAVVYVNGAEVGRANMPAGTISNTTLASSTNYTTNATLTVPSSAFTAGNNIIAVEVHQRTANSTNCYFDMSMSATGLSTVNSSSADLILPAGTNTIKFARLYWGGRINKSTITAAPDTLRKIKIRKGTSVGYSTAIAPASNVDTFSLSSTEEIYQAYVDVTAFVQANGAGTYTIADLPATPGSVGSGGKYAGWAIVVAYENTAMNFSSVRIYDGFSRVYDNGSPVTSTITLTGLNVPNNPLAAEDAVMATMVWEGDGNLGASVANPAGDYLKINNIAVYNAVNPVSNFWNGTISKNGAFVSGTKNPDYYNQMGIDIDEINVGTGYNIQPNATSVSFEFGTEADQYFPSIFSFAIRMKDPVITLDKTVADANNDGFADSNEELTYTLSGSNNGPGAAYNATIIDSLPVNVTYVANSLEIVNAPGCIAGIKTDAQGDDNAFKATNAGRDYVKFYIGNNWTANSGGELPLGSTYTVKLKVRTQAIPGSVTNTARITANSQAGDQFIDDGTAVISPSGGPVDVKLSSFTAKLVNSNGVLNWVTEQEVNSSHFEIERSEDAVKFENRGSVNAAGNSSTKTTYGYNDPINTSAKVVYYRLKMVDLDGKYEYSKIIAIKLNGSFSNESFSVYPNPFINDIKVRITSSTDENATFRILSFDGRELASRKISIQKGDNIVVLKDLGMLPKANYILEMTTASDKLITKITKN